MEIENPIPISIECFAIKYENIYDSSSSNSSMYSSNDLVFLLLFLGQHPMI